MGEFGWGAMSFSRRILLQEYCWLNYNHLRLSVWPI
jgi:hypothetical protein